MKQAFKFDYWRQLNCFLFIMMIIDSIDVHNLVWPDVVPGSTEAWNKQIYNTCISSAIILGVWA